MKRLWSVAAISIVLASCERGGEVIVAPGEAPGVAAETYETILTVDLVDNWIDSSFIGFAKPENATFLRIEEGTTLLASRGLVKFGFIEDTVFVDDTLSGTLRFDSARVIFTLDSTRTELATGGTTVQLVEITQEWDRGSANWQNAVDSVGIEVPWNDGPGGSFGIVLGDTVITEEDDSVVIWLDVDTDSLLRYWLDTTQVNTGLGVLIGDSGVAVLQVPRIQYNLIPETNPDTAIQLRILASDGTFIFDRSVGGPAEGVLRVGGVDGWRPFLDVTLPDSVPVEGSDERVSLRRATINKALLYLISRDAPDPPFAADQLFFTVTFELAGDFTVIGAKTPVGDIVFGSDAAVDPDSLQAGDPVTIDITFLLQRWVEQATAGTVLPLRLSIRASPEATTFGYWDFGAGDGDPDFRPSLRVVFTPPTEFLLP